MTGEKMKSLSFLTGFGDPDSSSEIRELELRPELMPRVFWGEAECFTGSLAPKRSLLSP